MEINSLNIKKYFEVEELFNKLKYSNTNKIDNENQNVDNGWIETLEMILNSLKVYGNKVTIDILVQYKLYLEDRYARDKNSYNKDEALDWIKGSLDAIGWFFNINIINEL